MQQTAKPQTARFWDAIAERYASRPIQDMDAYTYTLDRIRSYLTPRDRVLELGCGTGSTALLLAGAVAQYQGTDVSEKMIDIARGKAQEQETTNATFDVADVCDPSLSGAVPDAVLALNLLHLVDDAPAALAQIHAMLKPGGYFISKTTCKPDAGWPVKFGLMMAALPVMQWLGKAPPVTMRTVSALDALIADAGFDLVETGNHPAMPPARFVVARKPLDAG
jgi:ubiquinone/menaquinone biosynthesis C-methylase UbiE